MKCINKNYYNVYIVTIKWDLLENGLVSIKNVNLQGFPGGAVVKNPPANAGHTGSSPGLGRSHIPRSN